MKCIMLKQPWAHLVAIGRKSMETRTWTTRYRGPLAIGASQAYDLHGDLYLRSRGIEFPKPTELVRSRIVATSYLRDVVRYTEDLVPNGLCPFTPGEKRFGWMLDRVVAVERFVPVKGRLGLFEVDL